MSAVLQAAGTSAEDTDLALLEVCSSQQLCAECIDSQSQSGGSPRAQEVGRNLCVLRFVLAVFAPQLSCGVRVWSQIGRVCPGAAKPAESG